MPLGDACSTKATPSATQSAVARLEGGGSNPSAELLQRLGKALGVRMVLTVEGEASSGSQPVVISNSPPSAQAS
jgi:transcriptional regulator with XRE-family HTH domain